MSFFWPKFYDADFRPDLKTNVRLHLQANMEMLRSFRDTSLFLLISLIPLAVVFTYLFFFPIVSSAAFRALRCESFDGGVEYMASDLAIRCGSPEHTRIVTLSFVAIGVR